MVAPSFFLFRPQPTHHATVRFMATCRATSPAACYHLGGATRSVQTFVYVSARSTRGSARPLAASPFLQSGLASPALQSRKNSAAAARPPSSFGSFAHSRSLPPPARGHAVCSGSFLAAAPAGRANVAPARRGQNHKGRVITFAAAHPSPRACAVAAPILAEARAVSHRLQARAKRNATVRAATGAPRRSCIACWLGYRGVAGAGTHSATCRVARLPLRGCTGVRSPRPLRQSARASASPPARGLRGATRGPLSAAFAASSVPRRGSRLAADVAPGSARHRLRLRTRGCRGATRRQLPAAFAASSSRRRGSPAPRPARWGGRLIAAPPQHCRLL